MKIIALITAIVLFLSFASGCAAQESSILDQIENNEELLKLSEICPAEVVPARDIDFDDKTNFCSENSQFCVQKCFKGSANHCFGLANYLNSSNDNDNHSRQLFTKSCQLGIASGCTNAAAGIKHHNSSDDAVCYAQTFKKTCEANDAWGCTMYAFSLVYGDGVEKNNELALEALTGSCRFGDTDPACSTGKSLAEAISKGEFADD